MGRALTRLTLAAPWGARAVRSALRIRRDECPRDHRGDAEQGGDDVRGGDAEDPPTDRRAEDRAGRTKREDVQGLVVDVAHEMADEVGGGRACLLYTSDAADD